LKPTTATWPLTPSVFHLDIHDEIQACHLKMEDLQTRSSTVIMEIKPFLFFLSGTLLPFFPSLSLSLFPCPAFYLKKIARG